MRSGSTTDAVGELIDLDRKTTRSGGAISSCGGCVTKTKLRIVVRDSACTAVPGQGRKRTGKIDRLPFVGRASARYTSESRYGSVGSIVERCLQSICRCTARYGRLKRRCSTEGTVGGARRSALAANVQVAIEVWLVIALAGIVKGERVFRVLIEACMGTLK